MLIFSRGIRRCLRGVAVLMVACSDDVPSEDELTYRSEALSQTAACPAGMNVILGTDGDDVLVGTARADCIVGGEGNDQLVGGFGNDLLLGGPGDDVLEGGLGSDRLLGGLGNDVLIGGGLGFNALFGDEGNDVLLGGLGWELLRGGPGNDVIEGRGGFDQIDGGEGDDAIRGGGLGLELIVGGDGDDACRGRDCERPEPARLAFCRSDADCASGGRCLPGHVCVACLADDACDDDSVCTQDRCLPAQGCEHAAVAEGTACSDGDACNGDEVCVAGRCAAGEPLACDDGLFCNGSERCDAAEGCLEGEPPAIDDGLACTVDGCDEVRDVVTHLADHALCNDGLYCNGVESCDTVQGCVAGVPPVLADDNLCTVDLCDETSDSVSHTPDDRQCAQGYHCTATGCASDCRFVSAAGNVARCVIERQPSPGLDLKLTQTGAVWSGTFKRANEPSPNYSGPTAAKNLLWWYYGYDASYPQVAGGLGTNARGRADILAQVTSLGPTLGCADTGCWQATTEQLAGPLLAAGTLPTDMRAYLERQAPFPGYIACITDASTLSADTLRAGLVEGNPWVVLLSDGPSQLRWDVITGFEVRGGVDYVRLGESAPVFADAFLHGLWDLGNLEPAGREALQRYYGIAPFTAVRWIARSAARGTRCF